MSSYLENLVGSYGKGEFSRCAFRRPFRFDPAQFVPGAGSFFFIEISSWGRYHCRRPGSPLFRRRHPPWFLERPPASAVGPAFTPIALSFVGWMQGLFHCLRREKRRTLMCGALLFEQIISGLPGGAGPHAVPHPECRPEDKVYDETDDERKTNADDDRCRVLNPPSISLAYIVPVNVHTRVSCHDRLPCGSLRSP